MRKSSGRRSRLRVRGRPRLADSVRAACFVIVTETAAVVAAAMVIAKGMLLMALVVLSSLHGPVKVTAVLGASAHVLKTMDRGAYWRRANAPGAVSADNVTVTARIYSRNGRIRLGYSGEEYFTEPRASWVN